MYVVATFEYSDNLEIAVNELESLGMEKKHILVLPLDKRTEPTKLFDSIKSSDGKSLLDFSAILGAIFMLLGGIYGFVLTWGPILWALIGLIFGLVVGFLCDLFFTKAKQKTTLRKTNLSEVIVMVHCQDEQEEKVKRILWEQFALGIATYNKGAATKDMGGL